MSSDVPAIPRVRRALLATMFAASLATPACDQVNEMMPWVKEQRRAEQEARARAELEQARARAEAEQARARAEAAAREAARAQQEAEQAAQRSRESILNTAARYGAPPAFDDLDAWA